MERHQIPLLTLWYIKSLVSGFYRWLLDIFGSAHGRRWKRPQGLNLGALSSQYFERHGRHQRQLVEQPVFQILEDVEIPERSVLRNDPFGEIFCLSPS